MVGKVPASKPPKHDTPSPPSPQEDAVAAFLATMPPHYRGYDPTVIAAHAKIVADRKGDPVHLDVWRTLADGGAAVCVVADDRSGLLSLIAAALTAHDLDVIAAQIYTRRAPGAPAEAIDLFWLRRSPSSDGTGSVSDDVIQNVKRLLTQMIRGGSLPPPAEATRVDKQDEAPGMTWVRFEEDYGNAAVLVVQTSDRPGLLLTISRALFCLDLQVVRSEVSTTQGRVLDRFYVVDFDGRAIKKSRRSAIEADVLAAIQSLVPQGDER
jgi:[protein-PII] uridylyltransferase